MDTTEKATDSILKRILSEIFDAVEELAEVFSGEKRMFMCFEVQPWKIIFQN